MPYYPPFEIRSLLFVQILFYLYAWISVWYDRDGLIEQSLHPEEEKWYYTERVLKEVFMTWLGDKMVKTNSTPRKT